MDISLKESRLQSLALVGRFEVADVVELRFQGPFAPESQSSERFNTRHVSKS